MRSNVLSMGAACILAFAVGCGSTADDDDDDDDNMADAGPGGIDAADDTPDATPPTPDATPECTVATEAVDCDDSVDCTDDTCVAGVCANTTNDGNCDDLVGCTTDTCDDTLDCVFTAVDAACDDLVGCTTDTCDATLDCVFTPVDAACDDLVGCTTDACDATLDCVFTPVDAACDDAVVCTVDTCDATLDCVFTPDDTACDDGDFCTDDICDITVDCTNPAIAFCEFALCNTALIFDGSGGASTIPEDAAAFLGIGNIKVDNEADFVTAFDAGGFEVIVFDVRSVFSPVPAAIQTRLDGWVNGGGKLIFGFWDLDADAAMQATLDIGVVASFSSALPVHDDPTSQVSFFDYIETFPSPIIYTDSFADDGDELSLGTAGFFAARFNDAATGNGAIAVTNGTTTIVNGFSPADLFDTALDADADGINDGEELMRNELAFLCPDGPTLYAADGANQVSGNLYAVEPVTGATTLIGPIGVPLTGLAFAPDGTLYGVDSTAFDVNRELVTIDPTTGAATTVGATGHIVAGLTALPDGRLIGWSEFDVTLGIDDDLIEIDPATGLVTVLGDAGLGTFGSGIAADAAGVVQFTGTGCGTPLNVMNTTDGSAVAGAALNGAACTDRINSATYLGGVLYGTHSNQYGTPGGKELVEIDVATGAVTSLGQLPASIDGLAARVP